MGAPAHVPTEKTRASVSALKSFGVTHDQIAAYINISHDTLEVHYRQELDTAQTKANAMVAGKLFKKATEQEDLTAMIFWLKTRARWREKDPDESKKFESIIEKLVEKMTVK
jgi:inorganic triphosphatase YgiF